MATGWSREVRSGALGGLRVVEISGAGPLPFAGTQLADLGADVIRVDRVRADEAGWQRRTVTSRSRRSLALDLRSERGRSILETLLVDADVLLEGLRPGVASRLGLGDADLSALNPRLIVARVSAWGQSGPEAGRGGFDLTCLAESGILSSLGRRGTPPAPPENLIADIAGGGLFLLVGVLAAIVERHRSGQGQTIDASMLEGVLALNTTTYGLDAAGQWAPGQESNVLTGGSPFYDVYECADGGFVALCAFERDAYAAFLRIAELERDPVLGRGRADRSNWSSMRDRLAEVFRSHERAWWERCAAGDDSGCLNVVRELHEVRDLPQVRARRSLIEVEDVWQPAPTPRFSRTVQATPTAAEPVGGSTKAILERLGLGRAEIRELFEAGVVGAADRHRSNTDPFL